MKVLDSLIPPTVWNVGLITISAVIGILFLKWATQKVKVPGLSELIAAV